MRYVLLAILIGIGAGFLITALATPADAPQYTPYLPCATEDSPGPCYWDADVQGNGEGRSFLVEKDGTVTYLD